jgi:hypothetical protein
METCAQYHPMASPRRITQPYCWIFICKISKDFITNISSQQKVVAQYMTLWNTEFPADHISTEWPYIGRSLLRWPLARSKCCYFSSFKTETVKIVRQNQEKKLKAFELKLHIRYMMKNMKFAPISKLRNVPFVWLNLSCNAAFIFL